MSTGTWVSYSKIIINSCHFTVVLLCCCVNFRIPRTKQEIEADYIRKQIARKFRRRLHLIPDSEMDEIDLIKGKKISFSSC